MKSKSQIRREVIQNEILPCPFCENEDPELMKLENTCWFIHCSRCNCEGPSSLNSGIAIRAWNKAKR